MSKDTTLDQSVKDIVSNAIALQVLGELRPENKDKLLAQAVAQVLDGYTLKSVVEKAVAERVKEFVETQIKQGVYDGAIVSAIGEGMRIVLNALPKAYAAMVVEGMTGRSGSYGSCGLLNSYLSAGVKEELANHS